VLEALSTPHNRILMLIFLAVCCVAGIAAGVVGISDNPPGILLAFLAATSFVLAFVHPWRTAEQFWRLLYASALGIVIFAILHNLCEALASKLAAAGAFQIVLEGISVAAFLLAVLVCPPAIVVGTVGSIVMFIRHRRRKRGDSAAA
jgi:hypothetical protein